MSHKHQLHIIQYIYIAQRYCNLIHSQNSTNKKNYHFDLTGAFSNIIEESEAIEYDDDDDEDEFDDDDDD